MSSLNVHEFSDANFQTEVLASELPVLVDFWAPWCGPCRMIGPIVEELAEEYAGKARVGKVNVDENPGIASEFRIQAIPALFIIKGGQVVDKVVGMTGKANLAAKLDAAI
jgi:thioredoxin 1